MRPHADLLLFLVTAALAAPSGGCVSRATADKLRARAELCTRHSARASQRAERLDRELGALRLKLGRLTRESREAARRRAVYLQRIRRLDDTVRQLVRIQLMDKDPAVREAAQQALKALDEEARRFQRLLRTAPRRRP